MRRSRLLLAAAVERIEVGEAATLDRGERRATVGAEFLLDGVRYDREFSLSLEAAGGPFTPDRWSLEEGIAGPIGITVRSPVGDPGDEPELAFGGEQIPVERLGSNDWTVSFFGYPGVYEAAVSSSDYFDGAAAQTVLPPAGGASGYDLWLTLDLAPTERFSEELLDQGARLAAACVESRSMFVSASDPVTQCHAVLDVQTHDACAAQGGEGRVRIDGWFGSCESLRGGGSGLSDPASCRCRAGRS